MPCIDPAEKNGTCIDLKSCHHLSAMFNKKPISPENRSFLRRSQCGFRFSSPYVCCAEIVETATADQTLKPEPSNEASEENKLFKLLKNKFPQPPECGQGPANDRIFGGQETEIDEFPWTVQLEFLKSRSVSQSKCTNNISYLITVNKKKGYHCGGSLINNRYVLSGQLFH